MKRRMIDLDPELHALLRRRSVERRAPPDLRARVLDRAWAIVAAGGAIPPPASRPNLAAAPPMPLARRGVRLWLAMAASVAIAGGAVGALAALHGRAAQRPMPSSAASASPILITHGGSSPDESGELPTAAPERAARAAPERPSRRAHVAAEVDRLIAEVDLVQRAHAAYTRRDFSGTLALVAEHARRFPKGHLAEEREALRVRSLNALGRRHEAHRAAAAFAVQFPRSVLLPRVDVDVDVGP